MATGRSVAHSCVDPRLQLSNRRGSNEFVWLQVTRRLQGTDIRGHFLAAVSRGPWSGALNVMPLNPAVEADIIAKANAHAGQALGSVRNILGLASQSSDSGHSLLAGFQ